MTCFRDRSTPTQGNFAFLLPDGRGFAPPESFFTGFDEVFADDCAWGTQKTTKNEPALFELRVGWDRKYKRKASVR